MSVQKYAAKRKTERKRSRDGDENMKSLIVFALLLLRLTGDLCIEEVTVIGNFFFSCISVT